MTRPGHNAVNLVALDALFIKLRQQDPIRGRHGRTLPSSIPLKPIKTKSNRKTN